MFQLMKSCFVFRITLKQATRQRKRRLLQNRSNIALYFSMLCARCRVMAAAPQRLARIGLPQPISVLMAPENSNTILRHFLANPAVRRDSGPAMLSAAMTSPE